MRNKKEEWMDENKIPLIEVTGLTKHFDGVLAVNDVSFTLYGGEIFGFLGPNGAGKTTTINMLIGLTRPDSGTIRIAGKVCTSDLKSVQDKIGVIPDESNLYPELTGFENLCFCGALYGMRKQTRQNRATALLKLFGLQDVATRKFGAYSKGMKRKLTIAAGIVHEPQILFLDEPTTGIDVASARQIRQLIADLHHKGTTIFLTTHYIEEAERLCERIAFIVAGRIVKKDSLENLLRQAQDKHLLLLTVTNSNQEFLGALSAQFPHLSFRLNQRGKVRIESSRPVRLSPLIRFIEEHGAEVTEARRLTPSLEDVFVRITGIEANRLGKENGKGGGAG